MRKSLVLSAILTLATTMVYAQDVRKCFRGICLGETINSDTFFWQKDSSLKSRLFSTSGGEGCLKTRVIGYQPDQGSSKRRTDIPEFIGVSYLEDTKEILGLVYEVNLAIEAQRLGTPVTVEKLFSRFGKPTRRGATQGMYTYHYDSDTYMSITHEHNQPTIDRLIYRYSATNRVDSLKLQRQTCNLFGD